ncbi:MAG: hypothetical protein PUB42_04615 [Firmicutes bacterium]|nr:hypothetical protein [Bacillota bacterium]
MFSSDMKRLSIDVFCIFSMITLIMLFCIQLLPFISSAADSGTMNAAIFLYALYTIFLTVFPIVLMSSMRIDKVLIIRVLCIGISTTLIIGTLYDLISFGFFTKSITDADYSNGFGKILWNTSGFGGSLLSIVIALCYTDFAVHIKHKRRISYIIFLAIFILSVVCPYIFSLIFNGRMPDISWLKKNMVLHTGQIFTFVSVSIMATSRSIWTEYIWS